MKVLEKIFNKYGGLCAYCAEELSESYPEIKELEFFEVVFHYER